MKDARYPTSLVVNRVVVVFLHSFSHAQASGLDLFFFAFLHGVIKLSAVPAVLYGQSVLCMY